VACPRKCHRRLRVKVAPSATNKEAPTVRNGKLCSFKREEYEGRSRRAAERKESPQEKDLEEDAVSAYPAERILPLKKFSFPNKMYGRAKVCTSPDSAKDLRI